jgi:hypothetical protein
MAPRHIRELLQLPVVLFVAIVSGCSVYRPYVDPCEDLAWKSNVSYADALACAKEEDADYRCRRNEQALITPVVGTLLIPITGAAIGLGVSGVSGDAITGLGLGGASVAAFGTLFSNRPREQAYKAGAEGVECVILATRGLDLAATEREKFRGHLNSLITSTVALQRAIASIADPRARPELFAEAKKMLAEANTLVQQGQRLEAALDVIGGQIIGALGKIRAAVNEAVRTSQPDLRALVAALQGSLPTNAQTFFAPGGYFGAARAPESTERMRTRSVLSDWTPLIDAMATTAEQMRHVERYVQQVQASVSFDACITAVTQVTEDVAIHVDPTSLSLVAGASQTVAVSGGVPPYTVTLLGNAGTALTKSEALFGRFVAITANADAAEGEYHVFISDATTNGKDIKVTVEKKP